MAVVTVCRDFDVASVLVRSGARVVLCRPDPEHRGDADDDADTGRPAGRLAVLVGDLDDPDVAVAALAMARELFGDDAVLVPTVSVARQIVAGLPRLRQAGSGTV